MTHSSYKNAISFLSSDPMSHASFNLGAATPSFPMNSIAMTLFFKKYGQGALILPLMQILLRFLTSFSAQSLTFFLGFPLQCPFLNLNSPLTYLSRSLKTKILVLKILTANSRFGASSGIISRVVKSLHRPSAKYTLASFPVEMHPYN